MELNDGKIKIIAYYLPQYYPFKENEEWWGKGFTEWRNVGNAKPLFKGHYQPKVPADLGYYDLRVPEVAEQQVELAKKAGVTGFCYWHYWFGNGKVLMDMPVKRLLETGRPDFPFCLSWANHKWENKAYDLKHKNILLQPMLYVGREDDVAHFNYCLPAFKDSRYMRVNGCPMFQIFAPKDFTHVDEFIKLWNQLIKKAGVAEKFYFVANLFDTHQHDWAKSVGFDAVINNVGSHGIVPPTLMERIVFKIRRTFNIQPRGPHIVDYKNIVRHCWYPGEDDLEDSIPSIIPNWDHTPRSGKAGTVYVNATPENFEKMASKVIAEVSKKENKVIMLKSWNEWGEGNYMEPDLKFGHGFIDALRSALDNNTL
jgi:hypothetical protein